MSRLVLALSILPAMFAPPAVEPGPIDPDDPDVLGELVVQASPDTPLVLPKLALEADPAGIGVDRVFVALVRRDMDLAGQFNVTRRDDPVPFASPFALPLPLPLHLTKAPPPSPSPAPPAGATPPAAAGAPCTRTS